MPCLDAAGPGVAGEGLADRLKRDWPELLAFRVTEAWASGFLDDFKAHWGPVLRKIGAIRPR